MMRAFYELEGRYDGLVKELADVLPMTHEARQMKDFIIELDTFTMTQLQAQALLANQSVDAFATELVARALDRVVNAMIDQVEQSCNMTLN